MALIPMDPMDEVLMASQEKREAPKTKRARENVGTRFDQFLGDRAITSNLLKAFLEIEAKTCVATTLGVRFSLLLKYIKKKHHVVFQKVQLEVAYEYIEGKRASYAAKQASIFTHDEVRQILDKIDRNKLTDVRDFLIFIVGIYCLGRVSEIYSLERKDARVGEKGIEITLARSKTDAEHGTQIFLIPFFIEGVDISPLWEAYVKDINDGFLWRRVTDPRLGKGSIEEVPRDFAKRLGVSDSKKYTSHGLRATGATFMGDANATDLQIMAAGNWKSLAVAQRYIRASRRAMEQRAAFISGGEPPQKRPKNPQPHSPTARNHRNSSAASSTATSATTHSAFFLKLHIHQLHIHSGLQLMFYSPARN